MTTLLSPKNLLRAASSIALLVLMICTPIHGQWKNVPAAAIPRGADGKPDLAAPAGETLGVDAGIAVAMSCWISVGVSVRL